MGDLISRQAVEKAIKEFNKKRVDKIPRGLNFVEHNMVLKSISDENDEMLKNINDIPTAYDVNKVVEQLKARYEENSRCSKLPGNGLLNKVGLICRADEDNIAIKIVHKGGNS